MPVAAPARQTTRAFTLYFKPEAPDMGWMKFLSVTFNFLGVLFFIAAAGAFVLGVSIGGSAGSNPSEGAVLGAVMGGMMGTVAAVGNFFASLAMFFAGAVLWALQRLLQEAQLHRPGVAYP